jgi:hypothetical protein
MKKLLLLFNAILFFATTNAQWSSATNINNRVTDAATTTARNNNLSVTDGAGGSYIAWLDSRVASNQSIYVQRISSNGTLLFTTEVLVTNAVTAGVTGSGNKSNLSIDADGANGVILAWQDARNIITTVPTNNNNDIFGQRVDAAGNVLWTAGGVRLTVSDNTVSAKINPDIATISPTEAIVIFGDSRLGNSDLFAQKISLATGAPLWATDNNVHGNQTNTQTSFSALADGAGGAFVVWQDPRLGTTNSDIYAQKIDNTGALLWGTTGIVVCNASFNQLAPLMVSDGSGGIVVTWGDNRAASADGDIYAQKLDGTTGAGQWGTNGVAVCVQTVTNQSNPNIVKSGSNYIIAWSDPRAGTGNRNIYANAVDNSGSTLWTTAAVGGLVVCDAAGNQPSSSTQSGMQITADGAGGAIVVWDDARAGTSLLDIYAQRLSSTGTTAWTTNGNLVANAANNQQTPVLVNDNTNNVIVSWRDGRNGTPLSEIFASKLYLNGLLPANEIKFYAKQIKNFVELKWQSTTEIGITKFIVQRSDDGINFYDIVNKSTIGIDNTAYADKDFKAIENIVFYRLKSLHVDGSFAYSNIEKITSTKNNISLSVYPNPAGNNVTVKFESLVTDNYTLQIFDAKGSLVHTKKVFLQAGTSIMPININYFKAGIYNVSLIGNSVKLNQTLSIVK